MTTIQLKTAHINEAVNVARATYPNGSTALVLIGDDGSRVGVATIAIDELPSAGNVFIKDWNENTGILTSLQRAGIVGPVIRSIPAGFVTVHEVELLDDLPAA